MRSSALVGYTEPMRLRDLAFFLGGASAAMLVYGSLHEANRLVLERQRLYLPLWPERLRGYKIAVLADLHLQGPWSAKHSARAVALALDQEPDMVVLAGDTVEDWYRPRQALVEEVLSPLLLMEGSVVAVPGNHDYYGGHAMHLAPIFDRLNIKYLVNEVWVHHGISWVGIDSVVTGKPEPVETAMKVHTAPAIAVWHEPDHVTDLPPGIALQISGHTHGGQFRFPGGYTPTFPHKGKLYPRGFFPNTSTPLYVSRGVGVTGPPTRFNCPPEVTVLELHPA